MNIQDEKDSACLALVYQGGKTVESKYTNNGDAIPEIQSKPCWLATGNHKIIIWENCISAAERSKAPALRKADDLRIPRNTMGKTIYALGTYKVHTLCIICMKCKHELLWCLHCSCTHGECLPGQDNILSLSGSACLSTRVMIAKTRVTSFELSIGPCTHWLTRCKWGGTQ